MGELGLGTVQLGLSYGIANQSGKPSHKQALAILEAAGKAGISCFDTASSYGESESLLGMFLSNSKQESYKVSSKIRAFQAQDHALIAKGIESELEASYKRLSHPIDYLLFHRASDLIEHASLIEDVLGPWQKNGKVGKIGVSVYTTDEAFQAMDVYSIEVIQAPVNVLDHRFINQAMQLACKTNNVELHGRSVYLQGLLCMKEENVPSSLSVAVPYIRDYHALCRQYHISPEQAAFTYVRDLDMIHYFFVGCESLIQLQKNTLYRTVPPLPQEMRFEIDSLFENVPVEVINPSLWKP